MDRAAAEALAVPGYFDRAGEAICRVARAASESEALHLLREAAQCIGADAALFCSKLPDAPVQLRFILACDPRWYLEYERTPTALAAPWLDYAAHCADPLCGSELACQAPGQADVIEAARRFGFGSMLIVPAPSARSTPHVSVLVLGSRRAGFFEDAPRTAIRVMARSLSMELHAWRLGQARRELIERAQLSETDIELLRQERKGCRTKDIARQLCMTAPAIDSRFQRLNARLGVPSRKAAASLAATFGIV
jgi:DNA-binding CsgD family transcriptional regulator